MNNPSRVEIEKISASLRKLFITVVTVSLSYGCGIRHAGPVKGEVVEAGTGRPIADAFIVAQWNYYAWHTSCFHVQVAKTDAQGKYAIPMQWNDVAFKTYPNIERKLVYVYKKGYRDIWSAGLFIQATPQFILHEWPDPKITSVTLAQLGLQEKETIEYPVPYSRREGGKNTKAIFKSPYPFWWKPGSIDDKHLVVDISPPLERLKYLAHLGGLSGCYGAGSHNRNLVPFYEALYSEAREIAVTDDEQKIARSLCRNLAYAATRQDSHPTSAEMDVLIENYIQEHSLNCRSAK